MKRASAPPDDALVGHLGDGAAVRVGLAGEQIAALTAGPDTARWLWSPIIDSHVHVTYWPVADQLARTGVEAVVDLAAPEPTLDHAADPHDASIDVLAAGPMLTRPGGYPLASWGADGYGVACADAASVTAVIDRLAAHGARVIKLALDRDGLDPALIPTAVAAAHAHQLKVAVHALSDASAAAAGRAGADVLAHTPVEPLSDTTIAWWRGRAVISTLAAFGGRATTLDNLRRLRAAGAIVLYGTDLGNTRIAGPNPDELGLLRAAGLDDAAITAAMTTAPAAFWGLAFELAPGRAASFLVLDGDPRRDARVLLAPRAVWQRGRRVH
ncbi:MAG TPA: hypothetical protein VFP84_02920 [Kofleriaceae bacterium]|nr:hypothetical protein [Kofleriaceae bacterium]